MHHQSTPLAAQLHAISPANPKADFSSILAKIVCETKKADSDLQGLNNKIEAFEEALSLYEDRNKPLAEDEENAPGDEVRRAMMAAFMAMNAQGRAPSSGEGNDCPMQ